MFPLHLHETKQKGVIPLLEKVRALQDAGAVGVVVFDDGSCEEARLVLGITGADDEGSAVGPLADPTRYHCGIAGSPGDGGFSKTDPAENWRNIRIPSVLITKSDGERLKGLMVLRTIKVPGFEDDQFITR